MLVMVGWNGKRITTPTGMSAASAVRRGATPTISKTSARIRNTRQELRN